MEATRAAIARTGKLFMYAEDWVYAPAVTKIAEIIRATKDKILFMKGEESHSGSHAAHAAQWAMTGGGSLIRMGCHPLSAVLYLKQVEAKARGESIRVASVTGDVGNVTAGLKPEERSYIKANPVDVEDWGTLTATFSDGTKATVFSGDMIISSATRPPRRSSQASTSPRRSTAKPAGNMSAWRRNGPAAICRRSRISWNASRPGGSRCRTWRWPMRRSR
jgi:predicted dehydrogenase